MKSGGALLWTFAGAFKDPAEHRRWALATERKYFSGPFRAGQSGHARALSAGGRELSPLGDRAAYSLDPDGHVVASAAPDK